MNFLLFSMPDITNPSDPGPNDNLTFAIILISIIVGAILFAIIFNCIQKHNEKKASKKDYILICKNCGRALSKEDEFCPKCGINLNKK